MTTASKPRAPGGLGRAGRRFWRDVVGVYELSPAEAETLRQCCRLVDLIERADAQLAAEDLTVPGSTGQQVAHPLIAAAAEMRRTLDALVRSLGLPMPDEIIGSRRSPQQQASAQRRWRAQRQREAGPETIRVQQRKESSDGEVAQPGFSRGA